MTRKASKAKVFDGERLEQLMYERGVTDADAAEACDVSPQSISNYRGGREPRSYDTICTLASLVGVQAHELFREEN